MFRNKILVIAAAVILIVFSLSNQVTITQINAQQDEYTFVNKWGSEGISIGMFAQPLAIAIDSNDDVYVTDTTSDSNPIQRFTNNGTFITSWGISGIGDGLFTNARGIGIDSSDNVYITSGGSPNTAVQTFGGAVVWGTTGVEGAISSLIYSHLS
jgi:hypothetical protein